MKTKTVSGKVVVSDDQMSSEAFLYGEWTLAQIAMAYTDGYDTDGCEKGEDIECDIRILNDEGDEKVIGRFAIESDGEGGGVVYGVHDENETYIDIVDAGGEIPPHKVKWK